MSKDKNFEIVRNKLPSPKKLTVGDIKVGDVFEREGGLHMKVAVTVTDFATAANIAVPGLELADVISASQNKWLRQNRVYIVNINTGSVWSVPGDEPVAEVSNVVINYNVKV